MENFKIRATLDCTPEIQESQKMYRITRGASAYLTYNLSDKCYLPGYSPEYIEQLTFVFKYGKFFQSYNMLDWLNHSEDTEFLLDKDYYEIISSDPETGRCETKLIEDRTGSPVNIENCYEIVELAEGEKLDYYMVDKHFDIKSTLDDKVFVLFYFSSDETKELPVTAIDDGMLFEVALRFDTDESEYLQNRDSVIVEPQQPILIKDSLYSHIK